MMGMETYSMGMTAVSLAGHDKGKTYVILSADKNCVYLVDGSIRTLQNPKKKKLKHVQVNHTVVSWIQNLLDSNKKVHDSDIIRALREIKES